MTKELNTKIEVIFKRSLSDILGGTPRVAEFEGMLHYGITKEVRCILGGVTVDTSTCSSH